MARKLRYLKEQMGKAGIVPSSLPQAPPKLDLDDLEVCCCAKFKSIGEQFIFSFQCI